MIAILVLLHVCMKKLLILAMMCCLKTQPTFEMSENSSLLICSVPVAVTFKNTKNIDLDITKLLTVEQ